MTQFNKQVFAVDKLQYMVDDVWIMYEMLYNPTTQEIDLVYCFEDDIDFVHYHNVASYIEQHYKHLVKSSVFHVEKDENGQNEYVEYFERDEEVDGIIPFYLYRYDISNYEQNDYQIA